jgi:predicted  nucleic acid-binding Zn-ribbon protein
MARYIDADKLKAHYAWWGDTEERRTFDEIVDAQPTADVQEIKHGKWETSRVGAPRIKCSFCKFFIPTTLYLDITKYNYCPHCGAIMDGEEIENERV